MTVLKVLLHSSIIFLAAWVVIPIVMDIIPKISDFVHLARKKMRNEVIESMKYQPEITLVIPVYNSATSLHRCIKSIHDSTYDKNQIYILFVDSMSTDNSFEIFCQCQEEFRDLKMSWIQSKQGKSQALNIASFNSYGKYIIHIDSEGVLHPEAIYNMVRKFETHPEVQCMTGAVMTNPKMIEETPSFFMRLLRKVEYFDYCQDFFAKHSFKAEEDKSFTMSGAFFAFRRSTALKTQLRNTKTTYEDMYATFQIEEQGHEKFALCNDAIFFVNPIETLDSLYAKRQCGQQGEIFPRVIWYLALIGLGLFNYSFHLVVQAGAITFGAYVLSAALVYLCLVMLLCPFRNLQVYNARKVYMVLLLPIYNLVIFGMRLVGAINSKVTFCS